MPSRVRGDKGARARIIARMKLDERLSKLSSGLSVREAALAHAKSLRGDASQSDGDKAKASEFGAIVELMFLMAAVDGEVAQDELDRLGSSVVGIVGADEAADLSAELARFADALERDGWRARMEAACASLRTEESKLLAFRLCAGVAFVDDHVAHAEAAAIEAMAAALGVDGDTSQTILREVMDELFGA